MDPLIQKQTVTGGLISRAITNLKKLGQANITRGTVRARLSQLEGYWKTFQDTHYALLQHEDAVKGSAYFRDNEFDKIAEIYALNEAQLLDILEELTPPQTPPPGANSTAVHAGGQVHASMSMVEPSLRQPLPKIEVPTFAGDFTGWQNYSDLFRSLIHDNPSLQDVQRLHYLKMSLHGEAQQLVTNLSVTAANYRIAWDTLVARYEDKRRVIHALLGKLMKISAMKSESASEIKRVYDGTQEILRALRNMSRPVHEWDDWLVYITIERLDAVSRRDWEKINNTKTTPATYEELETFLRGRIRELEILEPVGGTKPKQSAPTKSHATSTSTRDRRCAECNGKHFILFCTAFHKKTPAQRKELVTQKQICQNCLSSGHLIGDCKSTHRCRTCDGQHHSLLHFGPKPQQQNRDVPAVSTANASSTTSSTTAVSQAHHASASQSPATAVLLATALVDLRDDTGRSYPVRALLDQGSEASFVTETVAHHLRLKKRSSNVSVSGLGGASSGRVRGIVSLQLQSRVHEDASYTLDAYVLTKLTTFLPSARAKTEEWTHISGLQLADPNFDTPARIDMVIGAHLLSRLWMDGLVIGPPDHPVAQRTTLGWILSGPMPTDPNATIHSNMTTCSLHCVTNEDLSQQLRHFFEREETIQTPSPLTEEETACEQHFNESHSRDVATGNYIVRLPFRSEEHRDALGDSRKAALRMLHHMEARFCKDPQLAHTYSDFMEEYQTLGHMRLAVDQLDTVNPSKGYILPHHAVLKNQSSTTKLRVVFNASQASSTGMSLNEALHVGPRLQRDISEIALRWRMPRYVFSADIEKMFRQIWVNAEDVDYQRILWRTHTDEPVREYCLLTVTYGTTTAPYLALRVLHQLAADEKDRFPLGSCIIMNDMYVDEALTGADTLEEAKDRQRELIGILEAGGFHPRKWTSNTPVLLEGFPENQKEPLIDLHDRSEAAVPILGLYWQPQSDAYKFRVQLLTESAPLTKRKILSDTSKLYDPLGWLGPVIITAKILLQTLWIEGVDWDTPLPQASTGLWETYRDQLPLLEEISITRWTGHGSTAREWELHGFADASERAYAAVVYLRIVHDSGDVQVTMLTAKTKVAPVKRVSLPRLELNAVVLLARLIHSVRETIVTPTVSVHLWTDSTVVLAWLKAHSARWKTYVANRVSEVQMTVPGAIWHHVPSQDNPADCASRGLMPSELRAHRLWWSGPPWLREAPTQWPFVASLPPPTTELEAKTIATHTTNQVILPIWELLERYSTLTKLLRVTACCMRFIYNAQRPAAQRLTSHLTPAELLQARNYWITTVQKAHFYAEYMALKVKRHIPTRSSLISLKPHLEDNGLLRVGGRLKHAILSHDEKYPIILPKEAHFTTLVVAHAHTATLHGGAQLTLSYLRRTYWIPGGRTRVQNFIRRCRVCLPHRWKVSVPHMGDLPRQRVTPARPFLHSGVDYAGPVSVKTTAGRGYRTSKGYIALFVCMATRAVHIEAVTDYTAAAFISAYKRFTARRGICSTLWSDQGTNFVGADRELRELFQSSSPQQQRIAELLANDGTDWRFIAPASPHFGGLWEAGVRSVKHHLRRVIGDRVLTYEELTTLLAEVEACLNSRPIQALTENPMDLEPLTPGHFLIGSALRVIPEPSLLDVKPGRLNRWQALRQMTEDFWSRWSAEYLKTLQQRNKWRVTKKQVNLGDLALITDEGLPPAKWALARIIEVHPGSDGEIRVVTLRTQGATMKRPVAKLCLLPRHNDDDTATP